ESVDSIVILVSVSQVWYDADSPSGRERHLTMPVNNLPVQPTPFIGRTHELTEILDLLGNPACRLLSLVGSGGMGKTRLAIEAAARASTQAFPGGVYFVPLQPISSSQFLPSPLTYA